MEKKDTINKIQDIIFETESKSKKWYREAARKIYTFISENGVVYSLSDIQLAIMKAISTEQRQGAEITKTLIGKKVYLHRVLNIIALEREIIRPPLALENDVRRMRTIGLLTYEWQNDRTRKISITQKGFDRLQVTLQKKKAT